MLLIGTRRLRERALHAPQTITDITEPPEAAGAGDPWKRLRRSTSTPMRPPSACGDKTRHARRARQRRGARQAVAQTPGCRHSEVAECRSSPGAFEATQGASALPFLHCDARSSGVSPRGTGSGHAPCSDVDTIRVAVRGCCRPRSLHPALGQGDTFDVNTVSGASTYMPACLRASRASPSARPAWPMRHSLAAGLGPAPPSWVRRAQGRRPGAPQGWHSSSA